MENPHFKCPKFPELSAEYNKIFRVYHAGTDGPLLLLLHGGGHSALSWAVFTVS